MTMLLNRHMYFGRLTWPKACLVLLLALILSGCAGQPNPAATGLGQPTGTPLPTETSTPLPSETPLPTASPTATLTPLPTATFTITPTALPWAQTLISAENAAQLTLLKSWGRGGIEQIERVGEDRVVLRSTTGIYVYTEEGANLLGAFSEAMQFRASPDSSLVAVNFPDGTLKVIRLEDGNVLYDIAPEGDLPEFELQRYTEAEVVEMKKWHYAYAPLVFSTDSRRLAFAYIGGTIGVWDMQDGALLAKLSHHVAERIYNMAFTPDNQFLLTSGSTAPPAKVLYWSIAEQKLLWYLSDGGSIAPSLFSPDGQLYAMAYNGYYQLYTRKDGSLIGRVKGWAFEKSYSPDSSLLVTGDPAGLMIWRVLPSFEKLRTLYLDFPVISAEYSEDGQQLIVNGGQRVYSTTDFSLVSEGSPPPERMPVRPVDEDAFAARGHLADPRGLQLSVDQTLSVWGGAQRAWRWEPFTDRTEWVDFAQKPMDAPAISNDGGLMAACSVQDLAVYTFAGQDLKTFERCLPNGVLAFAPNGKRLVWSQGSNFHVVNPQDGSLIQDFVGSGLGITWLAFSEKGNLMVSAGRVCGFGCTGDIHLWTMDPPGGVSLEDEHTDWVVTDVVFSPDEQWMYVAKRFIWLWDAKTGALKGRFPGEGNTLALSPDGSLLAVAEYGGNLRLMTTADRQEIASIQMADTYIIDMLFTPDGQNLVTLSQTGAVRLWGLP
jgi:WD40 repeat protein